MTPTIDCRETKRRGADLRCSDLQCRSAFPRVHYLLPICHIGGGSSRYETEAKQHFRTEKRLFAERLMGKAIHRTLIPGVSAYRHRLGSDQNRRSASALGCNRARSNM
jgi:hypothetical protein